MNVNNLYNSDTSGASLLNLDQTAGASRTSGAAANQSAGAAGPGMDSIALTGSSSLVQQALQAGSASRNARIQQLRALIQNNQYSVSPQELSSALISAHLAGE